ncbi:serine hydrolase domain-containing protein [Caulobacter mirabilis]|uniref:serine hydrolase domain-containing protein n=1 Tax=Caulobacter mirabilis TaxID=69666 RepID=UPI001FE5CC4A|nr:serine hydrolase domain-containing protein [Caulobacter mirabilis]
MRLLSKAFAAAGLVSLLSLSTTSSAQQTPPPSPSATAAPAATPPVSAPRPAPRPAVRPPVAPAPQSAAAPVAAPGVAPLAPAELEAFVDGMVRDAMSADHIPGVTVSVVQNGQVILKKGYGFSNLEPAARAVDPDRTLFRIASISKTFTWIAVMKEVEAGRLRLDAPINLYLPEKVQVRDQGFTKPITMLDLMSHTPGFEDRALGQLFERDADRVRPQLTYLRQERPRREFEPGSTPAYSNYGVGLAGAAVAYVGQKPFETIVENTITGPLGMTRTTFRDPYPARPDLPSPMSPALARDLADGFFWTGDSWRKRPYEYTSQGAPAGGVSTTAADMSRYMMMILNGGTLDGAAIYNAQTAHGFRTAQSQPAPGVPGLAHGFLQYRLPGGRTGWGHDGALLSFRSSMVTVPELGLGIFIAANAESGERLTSQTAGRIVQRFYGPPAALPDAGSAWLKSNAAAFEGQYVSSRRAFHGLEKFVGLLNGRVTVAVSPDGRLLIRGFDSASAWVPQGTDGVFREVGGWRTIVFAMQDGRATGYYNSSGVAKYAKVGLLGGQGWLGWLTALTAIAAIATLAGIPMRGRRDSRETPMQRRASLIQSLQAVLWLAAIGATLVWLSKTGDVAAIFFDWPGAWLLIASSCALVAAVLSVIALGLTPFVWRGGRRVESWTVGRKLAFSATVLIYLAYSALLTIWGAIFPWAG